MSILLILVILLLIGALPVYPYSRNWGAGPSLIVTVILIVLLLRLLGAA